MKRKKENKGFVMWLMRMCITVKNHAIKIGEALTIIFGIVVIVSISNFLTSYQHRHKDEKKLVLCEEQYHKLLTKDGAHISFYVHVHANNPDVVCNKIYLATSEYMANYTLSDYVKYENTINEIITKQALSIGKTCDICEIKINQ